MSEYVLILLWIGLCALFAKYVKLTKAETVCGIEEERYHWFFAIIVFLPVIIMAGYRSRWFADTGLYVSTYLNMPETFSDIPHYLEKSTKDKGFAFLSCLLRVILGDDFRLYLFLIALIQGILLVRFYRKYSINYVFSIFLFVASTDCISWMFNGIRQFIAVTIILAATPLMIKETNSPILKKYLPLVLVIIFASFFHQSALIMIPIVLFVQGEAWSKKTLLFIAIVLLTLVFIDSFTSLLDNALSDTQYKNVVSDYKNWNDNGTNPIRVVFYSVPAILSFIERKKINSSGSAIIRISANMSIISAGLFIVSMVTSGIYIGRLPVYCSMFGYILLPWELKNLSDESTNKIVTSVMVVLFIIFYIYQTHFVWQLY